MRVVLASLCLIAFAAPAAAQHQGATPDALTQVYACASQADSSARLACYDAAVGRLQTEQTAGNIVAVDRGQIETIERETFGFLPQNLTNIFRRDPNVAEAPLSETALIVERVVHRGDGPAFRMTNGQVWEQVDSVSARNIRAGGGVTIRRAALGSFLMSAEAGGPALRVRRVE